MSRKLTLIYLLDLTAVIFVSGILINEKFIAIDFARKEIDGNAYIARLRPPVLAAVAAAAGADAATPASSCAVAVRETERALGHGMQSADTAAALADACSALAAAPPGGERAAAADVVERLRASIVRLGNQSNLILDPDLDSYYTMSLMVLRYPELLDIGHSVVARLDDAAAGRAGAAEARTRHLLLEGRLEAVRKAIDSDHREAVAAGGVSLQAQLDPALQRLKAALDEFELRSREAAAAAASPGARGPALAAYRTLLVELDASWAAASDALATLLAARVDHLYRRMWMHLGTALGLLLAILGIVFVVARHIAAPLRQLAEVTDTVRRTGDHGLRAHWDSRDEIGRLVRGFNEMLVELDRVRESQKELAASARAAEAQRMLVEVTPFPVVVTSIPGHEVLHANPPSESWLAGCRRDPWAAGLAPEQRVRFFQQLADRGAVDEFEVHWKTGAERSWAMLSARRVQFLGQDALLTAFAPINQLKLMERRLHLWAKVFEASTEGIVIVDASRRIISANRALSRQAGYETADVIGERPALLFVLAEFDDDRWWRLIAARGQWQGELQVRRRDGSEYAAWLMVSPVRQGPGEVSHYIFTSIDISDRKKAEQRIRFLADHDVLTELANRSLCMERLRSAVETADRRNRKLAVMFIDLDRFKDINDTLGHHIGDGLLCSVARRLVESTRVGDTVARLGGDEFAVILQDIDDVDQIVQIVEERLIPAVRRPHDVEGAELHVSCSVGIAVYPDDARDIHELMRHADTAMYQAKAAGRDGAQFFEPGMTARAQARMQLSHHLRHALELDQLRLHWQPRVDARSARLVGVEGLLRWEHPERGLVSPAQFVPLAEETGLIVPIGAWVIEEACRQARAWRDAGLDDFGLSINVSARQLLDECLPEVVGDAMRRHGLPPGVIELELTESMVMENAERNLRQMHAFRRLGIGLAIDDFGTGYSSLAYLNRFPIDKLKIDRSFVRDMLADPTDRAITMAIIHLGHTLGLKVVAEGVEQESEAALLTDSGCDELQGYLFGRPMPAREFEAWARAHTVRRTVRLTLAAS